VRRLSIVLSILLVSAPALADDVEAARKKFAEGVRLYQKGDFEGARQLFVQANAEHHAAPIVYNLALAEEKLGHAQAAIDDYESYVAEAGSTGEYISAATVALAEIKSRSTKLRVESKPEYIARVDPWLRENGFFEYETEREVQQYGGVAHVLSTYESRYTEDGPVIGGGKNSIQLVHDGTRWWITAAAWNSAL